MKKLTILCSLVLAASVIPSAVACEGKKKMKRATLEPVREYRVEESVSFRPYTSTGYCVRSAPIRRAYWVPGYYSMRNGCSTWIGSSWAY